MARILVCDDSAFMRMILKQLLTENGHEVVAEAGDGREAVKQFRTFKPDIITMDVTMPRMDGLEAVKIIHEEDPLVRIIMVTAIGQKTVIQEAVKAGATDFIVKPFENEKVIDTIKRVLGEY